MPPRRTTRTTRGPSKQAQVGNPVQAGETLQTVFHQETAVSKTATTKGKNRQGQQDPEDTPAHAVADTLLESDPPQNPPVDDDPFVDPIWQTPTGAPACPPDSPHSTINIDDVSPTTSDDELSAKQKSPSQASGSGHHYQKQTHSHSPRAGPHSKLTSPKHTHKSTGPAGNRRDHEAQDVWEFFDSIEELVDKSGSQKNKPKTLKRKKEKTDDPQYCFFCKKEKAANPSKHVKVAVYSTGSSTTTLQNHLVKCHFEDWVDSCDDREILIKETLKCYADVEAYRNRRGGKAESTKSKGPGGSARTEYSKEAFVDAITDFIIADDQSINVIECPQLRGIFCMLRDKLKDQDIPHRTILRQRIMERLDEHIAKLEKEMGKSIGKISFTMDLWTDPNLVPYMAVTAHWVQAIPVSTAGGVKYKLTLRTDLIGFQRVPGRRHTGEHLSVAFMSILKRLKITSKIGWVTMDNATNNDKVCAVLEKELKNKQIPFEKMKRRVRCFPHIVNLACKAVLSAITKMQLAAQDAPDFEPQPHQHEIEDFFEALDQDPVASIRSAIRNIRVSSLRRQQFSETVQSIPDMKDLQLIKDVDTQWSSTLLMIVRALELQEWEALETIKDILMIPHAFQQVLSFEKTPTLGDTIPAFQAMITAWKKLQNEQPEVTDIIQAGLDKLEGYQDKLDLVPANILATLINPKYKLRFFQKRLPEYVARAKRIFLEELCPYYTEKNSQDQQTQAKQKDPSWANLLLGFDSPVKASRGSSLEEEIDSFLGDRTISNDAIAFWEDNQFWWPTIFALAMDILPIQGSSVLCERIFSSGKETATARRNRIKPALMEALQILKFAIKNGHTLNFMEGTSMEEELQRLESEGEENQLPENLTGFRLHMQKILEDGEDDKDEEAEECW